MCGISGIAFSSRSGRDVNEATLVRMRDVLRHRGPDDAGLFIEGPVGLAHRRLSIIDLALGHQPMPNGDGSLQIVFNGKYTITPTTGRVWRLVGTCLRRIPIRR